MFEFSISADIGSAYTRAASKNKMMTEETRAALDPANTSRVLAFGSGAAKLLNAVSVYPVRGCVADITLTAIMLRRFALALTGRKSLLGVGLRLALPLSAGQTELAAALEVGREAGFTHTSIVDSMEAGADGAGLDRYGRKAVMIADIGSERLSTAIFANGWTLARSTASFGSSDIDRSIQAHFALEHDMLISLRTAERIKRELGRPRIAVHGQDPKTGAHLVRQMLTAPVREAAEPVIGRMCREIASTAEAVSPDAAADLLDGGVTLIGGGANMFSLAERMEKRLGIPVRTAENAEDAIILGMTRRKKGPGLRAEKRTPGIV